MGHADIKTTMRYLHNKSRATDAHLLSAAFEPSPQEEAADELQPARRIPPTFP